MSGSLIAGLVFVAIGLWMVSRAFRRRAKRVALLRDCIKTKGTVIRIDETTQDGDTVDTYAATVKYKAKDGQSYELTLLPEQRDALPRIGSRVPVFYERNQPQNSVSAQRMWDVNLVCTLSFIPLLFGALMLFTAYQEACNPTR
jgi:cytochrome c oxidase assembly protein Cox11